LATFVLSALPHFLVVEFLIMHVQCVKVFADGMGNRMAWATAFGAFIAAFFNTGDHLSPSWNMLPSAAPRACNPLSACCRARPYR